MTGVPARSRMVINQIEARGVRDPAVLAAMGDVPREAFVPPDLEEFAYEDAPLPIEAGQTISQPYIVALMIAAIEPTPEDRVLEVGTGSGYAAAVLSRIVKEVYTVERHESLARVAEARFARLGYANIRVRVGDGTQGWPEYAPFDGIVVSAGGSQVPPSLLAQLTHRGRLVIPVGMTHREQELVKVVRTGLERFDRTTLGRVQFVPLIGTEGWGVTGLPEPPVPPRVDTYPYGV
jgi:protein-L-isoaspartate(D-aspartate) O-methyltransferase